MRLKLRLSILLLLLSKVSLAVGDPFAPISLNGEWQMGYARVYTLKVKVPSIANDPTYIPKETLWHKKEIKLPQGNWKFASLELKGARFLPELYVNGKLIAKKEGGMAPVLFILNQASIAPGKTITIEIALASLKDVSEKDASYIPQSDQWRSNVSSGLWDDVVLHLHGTVGITRTLPFVDEKNKQASIQYELNEGQTFQGLAQVRVIDRTGKVVINQKSQVKGNQGVVKFSYKGILKEWSPTDPNLYRIRLTLISMAGQVVDETAMSFGIKSFEIKDKQFYLNGLHFIPKGPTVVWHRWMRTAEGRDLGYDTTWFKKNIIQRTKDLGGNYLRFHLGLPPERFLDLCDRYGLVVQFEWSFFHGMPASKESLLVQYKSWLDLAVKHPSVSLIHPYNETEGEQLKTAWSALDTLLPQYPPMVVEDRDVLHIHKYWWSMFENLGIYYDSASIFPKAIMADEFGGNYLDGNANLGGYPSLKESYLRFLGRTHTTKDRLEFHMQANTRIAEYWRRIGAAGFSPFCALGSYEDGNHWFLGPLAEGKPKPVWEGLAAAFSPQSVSLDLWDKSFEQGQMLTVPVHVFNDENYSANLKFKVSLTSGDGTIVLAKDHQVRVNAQSKVVQQVSLQMPSVTGKYQVHVELLNPPVSVKHRVISEWGIEVFKASVPETLAQLKIGIAEGEKELVQFFKNQNLVTVPFTDASADVLVTGQFSWKKLVEGDSSYANNLKSAISRGKSVVMLEVGDRLLGQGYPMKSGDLGPLQGVVRIYNPKSNTIKIFDGISLKFTAAAEPESFIHPDQNNGELWNELPNQYKGVWNGMRGGLIVPAADLEFIGLSAESYISQWLSRGAVQQKIKTGPYYAYELQGFYDFSAQPADQQVQERLRAKIRFLAQDAPSLANALNPLGPIVITDLKSGYDAAAKGKATSFTPLVNCGKNLTRTPVALVGFGEGKGKLLVSQLLTTGRLAKGFGEPGLYGIRYDEIAVQMVLNMIKVATKK